MPKWLIIGYGNMLRSDDGVGRRAAEALKDESPKHEALINDERTARDLEIIGAHQLTPELAEPVGRARRVLFLDASHEGMAGEIRRKKIGPDPDFQPGAMTHDLSPQALLAMAARYFHSQPEAELLTLTGENFDLGEAFSEAVAEAWPAYLNQIRDWIKPQ
jgi:hydrogenase maturation protease